MTTDMHPPVTGDRKRITRTETLQWLGISTTTLHRYIERGHLHPIKASIGHRVWFYEDEVDAVHHARHGLKPGERWVTT